MSVFRMDETKLAVNYVMNCGGRCLMIDVGAWGSPLVYFLSRGWTVFAMEPSVHGRKGLEKLESKYSALHVDKRAASDVNERGRAFYTSPVSSGISGLHPFHPSHAQTAKVDTVTLSDFCMEKNINRAGILKIDTEGHDMFVLRGFPWDRFMPEVVVCEFEDAKTHMSGYTYMDLTGFLRDKGYEMLISEWEPIQEYGSRHTWRRLAPYPCEIHPKSWGNIIACRGGIVWEHMLKACLDYGRESGQKKVVNFFMRRFRKLFC